MKYLCLSCRMAVIAGVVALSVAGATPSAARAESRVAAHYGHQHQHYRRGHWVAAWQGSPTAGGTFDTNACPSDIGLNDQTIRNIVPVSTYGDGVRIRISNAFGDRPLQVGAASIAMSSTGATIQAGTMHPLTFHDRPSVLLAAGGEALSDPVRMRVRAENRLAISIYLPEPTGPATQHNNSRETNYLAAGDRATDTVSGDFDRPITCWMFASGIDVHTSRRVRGAVVTLGDSITDGDMSSIDADHRYPDYLARRLAAVRGPTLSVSNAGIGGNELLVNRVPVLFGISADARLPRDVLAQTNARAVILLEGINDIGAESARARDLIQAEKQIARQVHAAGLRIYAGTLSPFGGSNANYGANYGTTDGDEQRRLLNRWIRTTPVFDGVIDFDAVLKDPDNPSRMLPVYDSGDHLHPSDAGYKAMADAVDLYRLIYAVGTGRFRRADR